MMRISAGCGASGLKSTFSNLIITVLLINTKNYTNNLFDGLLQKRPNIRLNNFTHHRSAAIMATHHDVQIGGLANGSLQLKGATWRADKIIAAMHEYGGN